MAVAIMVNGEPQTVDEGTTVFELLKKLQIEPERVAVELDRKILKSPLWGDTVLVPGARLEIVQFVGGG